MKAVMHSSGLTKGDLKYRGSVATNPCSVHSRGAVRFSKHPEQQTPQPRMLAVHAANPGHYGGEEKVHNLLDLLRECDDLDDDLLEDVDEDLPIWEHEKRVKALPFTEEELVERELFLARQQQERVQLQQQAAADLLPDPLAAVADVVSAYTAEQGFRQMSVQELSVALTAGGLIDLLLDVRSHEEFAKGPTIPTAVNIPLDMLSDAVRAGQLDPYHNSSIAVVCASGQRSAQATVRLSKVFAFQNVVNLTGGMAAWEELQQGLKASSSGGGCGCGSPGSGGCSK